MDSTTSLLTMIKECQDVKVNFVIMRRALKNLVNQDVKLVNWNNLLTETLKTVRENWTHSDEMDSSGFFYLCLSQSMQKMVKTATLKVKAKDCWFKQDNNKY